MVVGGKMARRIMIGIFIGAKADHLKVGYTGFPVSGCKLLMTAINVSTIQLFTKIYRIS
jgi:hypothetical protein